MEFWWWFDWYIACLRQFAFVVLWCNHPSMYTVQLQYMMSSSACNLCTIWRAESCHCWFWLERWHTSAGMQHARSVSGRPSYRRNHCKANGMGGMPAPVRAKVALYSIPFSNRVVAIKLFICCLAFINVCCKTLRHLHQSILRLKIKLYIMATIFYNFYKCQWDYIMDTIRIIYKLRLKTVRLRLKNVRLVVFVSRLMMFLLGEKNNISWLLSWVDKFKRTPNGAN